MPGDADPYLIESAAKVLDVLDLFRRTGAPLTLGDVSAKLRLPKSTAFRLLYTLEKKGCLHRIPDSYFYAMRERRQVGLATASPWIPFAAEITRGLRNAASRCGVDLLIASNELGGSRTLANVEELLAAKVDLLIEINQDAKLGGAISERCRRAGTPLIAVAFPLPGATHFGVDVFRAGLDGGRALAGEVVARWRGEVDLVVLLNVPDAGNIQRARLMGMLQGLRELIPVPADRMLALTARRESDEGRLAIGSLLARSRGRRIVILATNDTQALAAVAASEHFDREREILILSQGGVAPARQELRRKGSSLWGTIAHFPESFGDRVLPAALRILSGEKVPSINVLRHAVLTQKNLAEHYPVALAN
jgi:ABC-type sugar transport system substrate-binding protein